LLGVGWGSKQPSDANKNKKTLHGQKGWKIKRSDRKSRLDFAFANGFQTQLTRLMRLPFNISGRQSGKIKFQRGRELI
jgi:hypothetical protein